MGPEYLEGVVLKGGKKNPKAENPFAEKESEFLLGIDLGYTMFNTSNNEVLEAIVEINTSQYPYVVNDTPWQWNLPAGAPVSEWRLPSGTPIFNKEGKIQCLLVSNGTCTTFKTSEIALRKEIEERFGHPFKGYSHYPDGDCCHATTEELIRDCFHYCAFHPCHPCPECRRKESSKSWLKLASHIDVAVYVRGLVLLAGEYSSTSWSKVTSHLDVAAYVRGLILLIGGYSSTFSGKKIQ